MNYISTTGSFINYRRDHWDANVRIEPLRENEREEGPPVWEMGKDGYIRHNRELCFINDISYNARFIND
jgi:hypothetical protein